MGYHFLSTNQLLNPMMHQRSRYSKFHWLHFPPPSLASVITIKDLYPLSGEHLRFHIRASHLRFLLSKTPMIPSTSGCNKQWPLMANTRWTRRSCHISLKVWGDRKLKLPIRTLFGELQGNHFPCQQYLNQPVATTFKLLNHVSCKITCTKHPSQKNNHL